MGLVRHLRPAPDERELLLRAASGLVYLARKLARADAEARSELAELLRQLDAALDEDDDEIALALVHRWDELTATATARTAQRDQLGRQADDLLGAARALGPAVAEEVRAALPVVALEPERGPKRPVSALDPRVANLTAHQRMLELKSRWRQGGGSGGAPSSRWP